MITPYYVHMRPRLNNIAYDSKEANDLPTNPVLSILQFAFHSGVDVSEPSQLVSLLWRKSLQYVSTIPGFQSLYWAPVDPGSSLNQHQEQQQVVIVLIQWDSGHGWKLFQSSLGFSMLLGYIENISNRCIQLNIPNLFNLDCDLELVSFQFPAMSPSFTAETDRQSGFRQKWENIFASHLSNNESELRCCYGEWLEADQVSEDRFFVGLLFWKPDIRAKYPREANVQILKDQIADLVADATNVVSVYTAAALSSEKSSRLQLSCLPPDSVLSQTNHPLFQKSVKPEYNVNEFTFQGGLDRVHVDSVRQARGNPPQRIACGPAGIWCPMGIISQHHLPKRQNYGPGTPSMEIISFRCRISDPRVNSLFEGLRRELWDRLGDCPELFWGRDKEKEGDLDKISLFVETRNRNKAIRAKVQQSIQEFSTECGDAIHDLSQRRSIGPGWKHSDTNMDIAIFDVSENERDQQSFEYAFSNYLETTHPKLVYGRHYHFVSKVTCQSCGWIIKHHSPSNQSEQGRPVLQFVSIFTYEKEGAGEEWYADFAQRAQTEYDLLGHTVDWIRTLSKRITIQRLALEKEDPWMTAPRWEKVRLAHPPALRALLPPSLLPEASGIPEQSSSPSPPAPSIFDIPWAKD